MTSIIGIFILSLFLSMLITPYIIQIAKKYGVVDMPSERKVHSEPIPRAGGTAIFLAFLISLFCARLYPTAIFEQLRSPHIAMLASGAFLVFCLGLWDDIRRLGPGPKFIVQIAAAGLAYIGGMQINIIGIFDFTINLGWFSLPVTIFWFLLVINAINLVDGLDGLAAGISLFVSLILLIICITTKRHLEALTLAALSGAVMGFLRYNFSPASIFMGDCGSYFLGYMLAGLSIMGSVKGSATVAILIPIIALGVPLIDVIFSPIRRFIMGQKLFSPDKNHLHHRLLKLGINQKNAVLMLYGLCIFMGILSILTIHAKSEGVALILVVVGTMAGLIIRKLGYMNYFGIGKFHNWVKDVSDEIGFSHERRSFLNLQIEIHESGNIKDLWKNICKAMDKLGFDMTEMHIDNKTARQKMCEGFDRLGFDVGEESIDQMMTIINKTRQTLIWKRPGFDENGDVCNESLMKMELPLIDHQGKSFGYIWLIKDLKRDGISHYTLRRVEHLRRSVLGKLEVLMEN